MSKFIRNWFSNFLPFDRPLIYDGETYRTPEHFYQAMKTTSKNRRAEIAATPKPGSAKRLGREVAIRKDWEDVKYGVMMYAQLWRFREGSPARDVLMNVEGDIVEWNNWHDRIWGKCVCEECGGEGGNLLGRILMRIRDEALDFGDFKWVKR